MFIYSVRASTIRFFSVIALTLAVLIGILAFGGGTDSVSAASGTISFSGVKTGEERVEFISQFGIKVDDEPVETEEFRVPENFDRVISGYNEIQKSQGLDLLKYKNKKVTRYTYQTEDYNGKPAFVNLIIYKGTVIACDVSSTDPNGFIEPLIKL